MDRAGWTLLSNHGLALLQIARRPDSRIRDVAVALDITERAAQAIVGDLVRGGYLERIREGRRNRYLVRRDHHLPHPTTSDYAVGELLDDLVRPASGPVRGSGCEALVVACSDYRMQGWLRNVLGDQQLLDRCELVLCPGGGAVLAGTERNALYATLERLVEERSPARLLLIAHTRCSVPGVPQAKGALEGYKAIKQRQKRIIDECRRRLHMEPELWLVDPGRSSWVRVDLPSRASAKRRRAKAV